jgi:uncharacterized iron-regulated membrane protein
MLVDGLQMGDALGVLLLVTCLAWVLLTGEKVGPLRGEAWAGQLSSGLAPMDAETSSSKVNPPN